jgi:hypothetical protein
VKHVFLNPTAYLPRKSPDMHVSNVLVTNELAALRLLELERATAR